MRKHAKRCSERQLMNGFLCSPPGRFLIAVAVMIIAMLLESWAQRVVYG